MAADRLAKCVSRNGCGDRHYDNLPCSRSEAAGLSESCGDRNTIQHPVYGGHPCLEHLGDCAGRLANVVSRHGTASTPLMPPEHSSRKKENLLGLKGPDQELRPEVCREQAGCPGDSRHAAQAKAGVPIDTLGGTADVPASTQLVDSDPIADRIAAMRPALLLVRKWRV